MKMKQIRFDALMSLHIEIEPVPCTHIRAVIPVEDEKIISTQV